MSGMQVTAQKAVSTLQKLSITCIAHSVLKSATAMKRLAQERKGPSISKVGSSLKQVRASHHRIVAYNAYDSQYAAILPEGLTLRYLTGPLIRPNCRPHAVMIQMHTMCQSGISRCRTLAAKSAAAWGLLINSLAWFSHQALHHITTLQLTELVPNLWRGPVPWTPCSAGHFPDNLSCQLPTGWDRTGQFPSSTNFAKALELPR